jgi:hypothetical protein
MVSTALRMRVRQSGTAGATAGAGGDGVSAAGGLGGAHIAITTLTTHETCRNVLVTVRVVISACASRPKFSLGQPELALSRGGVTKLTSGVTDPDFGSARVEWPRELYRPP